MKIERHYFWVLVYIPLIAIFCLLQVITVPKYVMYMPIDSYIPYIKYFVIFYFTWFLYMFAATAYFMFYSKEDFLKLTAFMSIGMALSFLAFFLFPSGQQLRPLDTGGGVTGALVSWIHKIDPPTNVCPSIHIINSVGVHICVAKSKPFGNNKLVKYASFFLMTMINLSTVFIKQHSVVDVIAGFGFVLIVYGIVFGLLFREKRISDIDEDAVALNKV